MTKFIKAETSRGNRMLINVASIISVRDSAPDWEMPHGALMPGYAHTLSEIELREGSMTSVVNSFDDIEAQIVAVCSRKGPQ
jgi:hypothetical protein